MHAWSTSMLLWLYSTFMLRVVKILLKREVGGCALNSHGNYIVDHGKSWKNHGIIFVFLNFCGNPDVLSHGVTLKGHTQLITISPCYSPMPHVPKSQICLANVNFARKYNKLILQTNLFYGRDLSKLVN